MFQQPQADADQPGVLHVLHSLSLAGAEVLVRDLVANLRGGFRFAVAALDCTGPLEAQLRALGAQVHLIGRRPGLDTRCASRIAQICREQRLSVIHAHQYTPFVYSALARLSGARARLIFTEHGRHYPDQRRFKRVVANRLLLSHLADRVTAVGDFVKSALVNCESIPAKRIDVIRNGIAPERFARRRTDVDTARAVLGLPTDRPLILQVAGFRAVKDHATAIRMMDRLRHMGSCAKLLLAGDGPTLGPTRQLIDSLKLHDHVQILGPRGDIAELWHAADLGLLTSLSEGVSVALLEAMAAGKPVVATDVGGNREIVAHGHTGLLAPRGDANALAVAVHSLLTDAPRRRTMGLAAALHVRDCFNQTQMHADYAQIYRELTATPETRRAA